MWCERRVDVAATNAAVPSPSHPRACYQLRSTTFETLFGTTLNMTLLLAERDEGNGQLMPGVELNTLGRLLVKRPV